MLDSTLYSFDAKTFLFKETNILANEDPLQLLLDLKEILQVRPSLKDHVRIPIGNGKRTSLWFDPWLDDGLVCRKSNEKIFLDSRLGKNDAVSSLCTNGLFAWPCSFCPELMKLLDKPCPTNRFKEDLVIWCPHPSHKFSICSTWDMLRTRKNLVVWGNLFWRDINIPRCSFVLWLAIMNNLSTQDRVRKRGMQLADRCYRSLQKKKTPIPYS